MIACFPKRWRRWRRDCFRNCPDGERNVLDLIGPRELQPNKRRHRNSDPKEVSNAPSEPDLGASTPAPTTGAGTSSSAAAVFNWTAVTVVR
jgi:hypothetical protein